MMTDEQLQQYRMMPLAWYLQRHGDTADTRLSYYQTFLSQTDYVVSKLAESDYSNVTVTDDYTEVLQARQDARTAINALQQGGD